MEIRMNQLIWFIRIFAMSRSKSEACTGYTVHILDIPKKHISSLITLEETENQLLLELLGVIRKFVAISLKKRSL